MRLLVNTPGQFWSVTCTYSRGKGILQRCFKRLTWSELSRPARHTCTARRREGSVVLLMRCKSLQLVLTISIPQHCLCWNEWGHLVYFFIEFVLNGRLTYGLVFLDFLLDSLRIIPLPLWSQVLSQTPERLLQQTASRSQGGVLGAGWTIRYDVWASNP